jgi:hypothetical protein
MATFKDLEQQNPNIREQYDTWRSERRAKGEDENDWRAFRAHLVAIGAPDPGENPIEDSSMTA